MLTEYLPAGENNPVCTIHGTFREAGEYLSIRKPLDRSIFYVDPQASSSHQSILIEAEGGRPGEEAAVYVNGGYRETIDYPYRYRFPLVRGEWQIRFQTETAAAQVSFTIR